jgi:H+/Cl- antiporter ClcA
MLCAEIIFGYAFLTVVFMFGLRERRSFRHASHASAVIVVMVLFFGSILLVFIRPFLLVLNHFGLEGFLW